MTGILNPGGRSPRTLWRPAGAWFGAMGVAVLLLALVLSGCSPSESQTPPELVAPPQLAEAEAREVGQAVALYDEALVMELYDRAIPAVVEIESTLEEVDIPDHPEIGPMPQTGQGSGFIIDDDGHILTNYHVISGATKVSVVLHDERILDAEVIGTDRENDLALLRIDPRELRGITPLPLGDSAAARPGQMAIALGSPFGLRGSITVGVISGVGRSLSGLAPRTITALLQTDAAINPGNSGGPLLNSSGEVVGINTAIQAPINGQGIGYAVPINRAKALLPALLEGGDVGTPWLGISGQAIAPALVERLELSVDSGVYVVTVWPGSPAEEAGLVAGGSDDETFMALPGGDIITAADGQAVASVEDLIEFFNGKVPGDAVLLTVVRGDETLTVAAVLGEWPEQLP